jgi:hypothetical protein
MIRRALVALPVAVLLSVSAAAGQARFEFSPGIGYFAPLNATLRSLREVPCSPGPCYDSLHVTQGGGLAFTTRVTAWWWTWGGTEAVLERASGPRHMVETVNGAVEESRPVARVTFFALRPVVRTHVTSAVDVSLGAGPVLVSLAGEAYQGLSYILGTERVGLSAVGRLGVRLRSNVWAEFGAQAYFYGVELAYPNANPGYRRSLSIRDLVLTAAVALPLDP